MCPEFIPYCWAHLPVRQPLQLTKIPSLLSLHLSPRDGWIDPGILHGHETIVNLANIMIT